MADKLIYVFDPLCGWCYGFHPVVTNIWNDLAERYPIEVLCGGNYTGKKKMPVKGKSLKMQRAYEGVNRVSGAVFSRYFFDNILYNHQYVMDSEPSCIAFCVMKSFLPDKALEIAYSLQESFFKYGKRMDRKATFTSLAQSFGIPKPVFTGRLLDPESREMTWREFQRVKEIEVHGYPSLFLQVDGTYLNLTEGFSREEDVRKELSAIL